MPRTVVLYFGSFNPIHRGHLTVADAALEAISADALWFVVSPQNPFKRYDELAPETLRIEMVRRAIRNARHADKMLASDIEFQLEKPSLTLRTLETLKHRYPQTRFGVLLGSDNIAGLPAWYGFEKIVNEYPIWVYPREGYPIPQFAWTEKLTLLDNVPLMPQAATDLRSSIAHGVIPENELPEGIGEFIREHHLYGYHE